MNKELDDLETYLVSVAENYIVFDTNYRSNFDKVNLLDWLTNDFFEWFDDIENCLYLTSKPQLMKDRFYQSCVNLGEIIEAGCYLYAEKGRHSQPLLDSDNLYSELIKWKLWANEKVVFHETQGTVNMKDFFNRDNYFNGIPEFPDYTSLDQCFNLDLTKVYLSKVELEHIEKFYDSQSNRSESKINVSKQAYRSYLDGNELVNLDNSKLLTQERRELVLKGWLYGKGYELGHNFSDMTRHSVWDELNNIDEALFEGEGGNGISINATPERFFKKQNMCSFDKNL